MDELAVELLSEPSQLWRWRPLPNDDAVSTDSRSTPAPSTHRQITDRAGDHDGRRSWDHINHDAHPHAQP